MPRPEDVRRDLEVLIVHDLLGPRGGPDEVLSAQEPVRDRYLTGMLAPRGTIGIDRERTDVAATEGDDTSGEAEVEDRTAAVPMLFPSSCGMSFAVAPDTTRLRVEVWWGRYEKDEREEVPEPVGEHPAPSPGTEAARPEPTRVWQRYQVTGTIDIDLGERIGPHSPVSDQLDVVLSGRVTDHARAKLVTLFLSNEQPPRSRNKDTAWLFQAGFAVTHLDGAAVFCGRREAVDDPDSFADASDAADEIAQLEMLYRDHVEFATGHGTAVHAETAPNDPTRAVRISTVALPSYELPRTEAPTPDEEPDLAGVILDMSELAQASGDDLRAALDPLVSAYEGWIEREEQRSDDPSARLADHRPSAEAAIAEARRAAHRIRDGIDLVTTDPDAAEAFRFANEAMWQQRIRTTAFLMRLDDPDVEFADALARADVEANRSWYPFQLAFVLLNLPSLTRPTHLERIGEDALADLLFFPTGGGKTEAYLGLCAYTFAIRRLQGEVAGRSGEGGVAVLMRYTLRLLTAQQFQRAAALICACEVIRRRKVADNPRWGEIPFRLGLWVGSSLSPNRDRDAARAIETMRTSGRAYGAQPVQLSNCPWCGRALDPGRDARQDPDRWRTLLYCGDPLGNCDFTEARSNPEGIPVLTVDEHIYRLLPAMVIATVDKFAQLPMQGPLRMLFGHVSRRCTRHGYRSADLDKYRDREEHDSHRATGTLPKAETVPCLPVRPPDLIIQDELHLISGPLGTLVGLYETAIDDLATWEVNGVRVRPKVVASTATVRRAAEQAHAIFWRGLKVFPPPVLDARDSFFARQREDKVGRRYLGICAPGTRLKTVERRIFVAVLAAAQALYEKYGADADPWMTLVGYFGSLRELGGMRRLAEDEVRSDLRRADRRGLAKRTGLVVRELTSRVASSLIREVLDELGYPFDSSALEDAPRPVDVLLATNMVSVGVDVPRLGLMVCVGQPKATAEYIQATSRVGRSERGPGLVLTIYNWARPRDLSHYETFEHYHATFYRNVEALSVTPFAARALDRGLTAVAVSMFRHEIEQWNANEGAHRFDKSYAIVDEIIERVAQRAEAVTGKPGPGDWVRTALRERTDAWANKKLRAEAGGASLGYRAEGSLSPLLETATLGDWPLWAVPNSLRETEPMVNLIIDERDESVLGAAAFELGKGEGAAPEDTAEDEEEAAAT